MRRKCRLLRQVSVLEKPVVESGFIRPAFLSNIQVYCIIELFFFSVFFIGQTRPTLFHHHRLRLLLLPGLILVSLTSTVVSGWRRVQDAVWRQLGGHQMKMMASATGAPSHPSSYSAEVSLLLGQGPPPVQPSSGLVTIVFCWHFTIEDRIVKKCVFANTHSRHLHQ